MDFGFFSAKSAKRRCPTNLVSAVFSEPPFSDLVPLNLEAYEYKEAFYYDPDLAAKKIEEAFSGTVGTYACFLRRTASASIDRIADIFKLANTLTDNKNNYSCWREIEFLWNYFGATDRVVELAEEVLGTHFEPSPDIRSIWQTLIASLLERNEKNRAAEWLEQYIQTFGLSDLESVFPICALAEEMGYQNIPIHEAAVVFNMLDKSRETLEQYFSNKTIAVVGSGPQEIGKARKDEIDGHDIVIRFNDCFPIKNPDDYGEKVTVWSRNMLTEEHYDQIDRLDLILVEPDTWHVRHRDTFREALYQYITRFNKPVANLLHDSALKQELNAFPTSGALVVDMLQRTVGNKGVDYYGFSFLEDKPLKTKMHVHYYEGGTAELPPYNEPSMHHNSRSEQIYLRKILGLPMV